MQGCDDFQPFFGLIASTVARSQLRQEHKSRDIQSSSDQSSSEEDDQESSQNSKSIRTIPDPIWARVLMEFAPVF